MKTRVVITGVGVVSPIGIGKEAFWESLKNGRSGVGRVTLFDAGDYPSQIDAEVKNFQPENYIDKKNIRRMDRFTQYAYAAADMAKPNAAHVAMRDARRTVPMRCIGHTPWLEASDWRADACCCMLRSRRRRQPQV